MSRSVVRLFAAAVVAAAVPSVASAQDCTVNTTSAAWSCASPIDLAASVQIPYLAYIALGSQAVSFPAPTGGWGAFLTTPAAEEVVTGTLLTIRTNATHTVTLTSNGWSGGSWAESDVTWGLKTDPAGCTAAADANTTLLAGANALYSSASPTGGVANRFLCLGLGIPGDLADGRLAPGTYTLDLTVTIAAP